MNKIEEMYSAFILYNLRYENAELPYNFQYENIDFPFLNWIDIQCNLNNFAYINKIWFDCSQSNSFRLCRSMLYDLYCRNAKYKKFFVFIK
jgi:hypothetical protein